MTEKPVREFTLKQLEEVLSEAVHGPLHTKNLRIALTPSEAMELLLDVRTCLRIRKWFLDTVDDVCVKQETRESTGISE